jgi:hypothetical protein
LPVEALDLVALKLTIGEFRCRTNRQDEALSRPALRNRSTIIQIARAYAKACFWPASRASADDRALRRQFPEFEATLKSIGPPPSAQRLDQLAEELRRLQTIAEIPTLH